MIAVHCSWNHNGSLLAISGRQFSEEKKVNLVQFYNPFGEASHFLNILLTDFVYLIRENDYSEFPF